MAGDGARCVTGAGLGEVEVDGRGGSLGAEGKGLAAELELVRDKGGAT